MKKNIKSKKNIIKSKRLIIVVIMLMLAVVGGTFAWFTYQSRKTALVLSIGEINDAKIIIKPYQIKETLAPVNTYTSGVYSQVTAINNNAYILPVNLYYKINQLDELLINNGLKYTIESSDSENGIYTLLKTGDFTQAIGQTELEILSENVVGNSTKYYRVYLWLDSNVGNQTEIVNSIVNLELTAKFISYTINLDANGGSFTNVSYTTSGEHIYTVPYDAEYHLEVWGAQGGSYNTSQIGGYGGYSVGDVELKQGTSLFVNVGGVGSMATSKSSRSVAGGANGGGNGWGTTSAYVGGGGGATHISTSSGNLSTFSSNINSILIVAGGGGGAAYQSSTYYGSGGAGGGISGGNGYYQNSTTNSNAGKGGTQTTAGGGRTTGSFGLGGSSTSSTTSGTGGGGGFYGGGGGNQYRGGGGGSGYIGNSLLTNKAMYCYNCLTSTEPNTLTYTTTNVSDTATSNYAKSGDGAANISLLSMERDVYLGLPYGELPIPAKEDYNFMGWNTKSDGSGVMVYSSSIFDDKTISNLYAIWFQGLPGDVNMDGVVNNNDETLLTTYVSNPSGTSLSLEAKSNADVNMDGVLDSDDVEVIQVYFEGGIAGLPYSGEIYTISYNMNGGTGSIANQRKGEDISITLSSTVPTISNGLVFKGWATSSTATSAMYRAGGTYNLNSSVTLYAVYGPPAINPITSYSCANGSAGSSPYDLVYTGNCTVINDGDGNWRVNFLTTGTLTISAPTTVDAFLVGGGGGGGSASYWAEDTEVGYSGGGGGGGGKTKTQTNISLTGGSPYVITVGSGGPAKTKGGDTSAFDITANGGSSGYGSSSSMSGGAGGSGGGAGDWWNMGGGNGGFDGSNGKTKCSGNGNCSFAVGGNGQGTTTAEFGEDGATLYAGGGGGGGAYYYDSEGSSGTTSGGTGGSGGGGNGGRAAVGSNGTANTGGGGGGGGGSSSRGYSGGSGGSGIIIIRNNR